LSPADLSRCLLYGILDLSYVDKTNMEIVAGKMIAGGVDIIQLRAKNLAANEIAQAGAELHRLTSPRNIPLIINDHADIAGAVAAEGVHVGQDDSAISDVRMIAGPTAVVGKSTHSVDQAIRAFYEGADYIGFGPVFPTPTKPTYQPIGLEEIRKVHQAVRIPIFCIGGITLQNLPQVLQAGARRVVIVSGMLLAKDIESYARSAKTMLTAPRRCEA
jgi:thiamine-phosphate pyrophosphorylase